MQVAQATTFIFMTRTEFEELQLKQASSGMSLKAFLKECGIAYTTYNYWWRKLKKESNNMPIAPISLHHSETPPAAPQVRDAGCAGDGVIVAFPNGVRAHFGQGSEGVLMEVLTKSMGHVLP